MLSASKCACVILDSVRARLGRKSPAFIHRYPGLLAGGSAEAQTCASTGADSKQGSGQAPHCCQAEAACVPACIVNADIVNSIVLH